MPRKPEKRTMRSPASNRTRRVRVTVVLLAGFLVSLSFVAYAFYWDLHTNEGLLVTTIGVKGTKVLDDYDIVEASGITTADNTLFLDVEAVQKRIEALPYVKACRVVRVFPGAVKIHVEEREAVAILEVHNQAYEIDADCVVLREQDPTCSPAGPYITEVPELGSVHPGQRLTHPPLREALEVWNAFSQTSMAQDVTVSELAALHVNDIRMYCDELPFEIRWGRGNFSRQARRLEVLWTECNQELDCQEYLELRFGTDLACK
jgi:cell division septal protein FtsQ